MEEWRESNNYRDHQDSSSDDPGVQTENMATEPSFGAAPPQPELEEREESPRSDESPGPARPADEPKQHVPFAFPAFADRSPESSSAPAPALPEPPVPATPTAANAPEDGQPMPVVKVLSVRGVEYGLMTFTLWFGAASLAWILLALIDGDNAGFDMLAFPISLLLVSLPVFAFFFLRLKRAEVANPVLRLEPSKRRFSQLTQFFTFLICLFNIVGFVYQLVAAAGGQEIESFGKTVLQLLVVLVIAGGLFAYYWMDEHRLVGRR